MLVYSLTIHRFHILVQYIPTVAKLKRHSNLIANLNDLTFRESPAGIPMSFTGNVTQRDNDQLTPRPSASEPGDLNLCLCNNP